MYEQLVSADDSLFALIFSFKLSASLRAAAILSWISPWFWDMLGEIGADRMIKS
jgi:hypothetical protein